MSSRAGSPACSGSSHRDTSPPSRQRGTSPPQSKNTHTQFRSWLMHAETGERGMPLHTKILIGLTLGALAGVLTNMFAGDAPWVDPLVDFVAYPIGQVFLRMLFMVVV